MGVLVGGGGPQLLGVAVGVGIGSGVTPTGVAVSSEDDITCDGLTDFSLAVSTRHAAVSISDVIRKIRVRRIAVSIDKFRDFSVVSVGYGDVISKDSLI